MGITCPDCHGEAVVVGKIYNQPDYVNPPAYFRPNSTPFFAIFNTNIQLQNSFFVCSLCGFVWSKVTNQKAQQSIVKAHADQIRRTKKA